MNKHILIIGAEIQMLFGVISFCLHIMDTVHFSGDKLFKVNKSLTDIFIWTEVQMKILVVLKWTWLYSSKTSEIWKKVSSEGKISVFGTKTQFCE